MDSFQKQLQHSLGDAYRIERELGGGGMSRVYLAEEVAFGRKVVVKVLPPDLAERVNVERFEREILIAANLQHPHIVPILAAGQNDGSPYYTMPFVEGASLRQRLESGPLPIADAVFVLRDVAQALAYAHAQGVVHRDIKPDNVLLAGGSATVTDFGIAKALAASRKTYADSELTGVGMSLGTPSYMAPEQAAGDPATDHRADIYAFGCMMYELLSGKPPFHSLTPQKLLAAQMFEQPRSVDELRSDTPRVLAELTMKCLKKDPDERPQNAAEIVRSLEAIGPGLSAQPAVPAVAKAFGMYAATFVIVAGLARWAMLGFGLPDWVFMGALILLVIGLPIVLLAAASGTRKAWRRTLRGGAIALGTFTMLVVATTVLRGAGVGPFASLLTAGALNERDRVIVADFETAGTDSALSGVLAEAARTSVAQSSVVALMPASAIGDALRRMNRPRETRVDATLAREIAVREGAKAVLVGKITPLAEGYIVSEALITAATGDELAAYRETVDGQRELIESIDRLTRKLRGKIGESLRHIRAEAPLERVTTSSLEALKKYSEGLRANNFTNEYAKATRLFEEAAALDSTFGMAYRSMSQSLLNEGKRARAVTILEKAHALRDRMTERERFFTDATWFGIGPHADRARQAAAYEQLLEVRPDEWGAMQNLAQIYQSRREFARAESLWKRAMTYRAEQFSPFNIIGAQISAGRLDDARRSFEEARRLYGANPRVPAEWANLLYSEGKVDSAIAVLPLDDTDHTILRAMRGQRAGAMASPSEMRPVQRQVRGSPVFDTVALAHIMVWQDGRPADAVRMMDAALTKAPLDTRPPNQRDFLNIATFYAAAKQPERARQLLAQYDAAVTDTARRRLDQPNRDLAEAWLAIASGRFDEAHGLFQKAGALPDGHFGSCITCFDPGIGLAYDLAGKADSAIATYEHFVTAPTDSKWYPDAIYLAWILRRLGELYEAKGDAASAVIRYEKFVTLWSMADAALQPQVADVRRRIARLKPVTERR
jgi:tetratricopeptide (TPR) repeat protein/tRNA A-37 threonylcarbamoyl transferase component Bud32